MAQSVGSAEAISQRIREHIDEFMALQIRLPLIEAINTEIIARQDSSPTVQNPLVWQMVLDLWAMFVIDLASLREGMVQGHGAFGLLRIAPEAIPRMTADCEERAGQAQELDEVSRRVFGTVPPLQQEDVKAAISRFLKSTQAIDDDRNKVRAHQNEFPPSSRAALSKHVLPLAGLREQLETVKRYLIDLGVLLGKPYILEEELGEPQQTARDLVDLLSYGSFDRMQR